MKLPLPRFGGTTGENVVVQQLKTAIWVPEQYALVSVGDDFEPVDPPYLAGIIPERGGKQVSGNAFDSWIGASAGSLIDFPTEGRAFTFTRLGDSNEISVSWWKLSTVSLALSIALVLIAFVMRKKSWISKIAILIFAVFILALVSLNNADIILHGVYAARFGIYTLLLIWLLYGFSGRHTETGKPHFIEDSPIFEINDSAQSAAVIPPPGVFDDFLKNQSSKK